MTEIMTQQTGIASISEQDIKEFLHGADTKLSAQQSSMFIGMAKAFNLNPFKREIYAIPFERNVKNDKGQWEKKVDMNIIVGYQVYIGRATATGLLDGWKCEVQYDEGCKIPKSASIIIYRKDFKYPFEWQIGFNEIAKKDREGNLMSNWKVMPEFMIKKVCIAQGFRLAFPNELGGMPYIQEELTDEAEKEQKAFIQNPIEVKSEIQEKLEQPIMNEKALEMKANLDQMVEKSNNENLSSIQLKKIMAMCIELEKLDPQYTAEYIKGWINKKWSINSRKELSKKQASDFIETMTKKINDLKLLKKEEKLSSEEATKILEESINS